MGGWASAFPPIAGRRVDCLSIDKDDPDVGIIGSRDKCLMTGARVFGQIGARNRLEAWGMGGGARFQWRGFRRSCGLPL